MTANAGGELVIPGVNVAEGLKRLGNNEKLYRRLLGMLVKNVEAELVQYAAAPTEDKRDEVRASAHKLKGSSSNLGATTLTNVAAKLEGLAKDPEQPFSAVLTVLTDEYLLACKDYAEQATKALA